MRIRHTIAALSLGLLMGAVAPVQGQDVDARWLPWLGCWQAGYCEVARSSPHSPHGSFIALMFHNHPVPVPAIGAMHWWRLSENA